RWAVGNDNAFEAVGARQHGATLQRAVCLMALEDGQQRSIEKSLKMLLAACAPVIRGDKWPETTVAGYKWGQRCGGDGPVVVQVPADSGGGGECERESARRWCQSISGVSNYTRPCRDGNRAHRRSDQWLRAETVIITAVEHGITI